MQLLPTVIDRLLSVKSMHDASANVIKRLLCLESCGNDIDRRLDACETSVDALTKAIERNGTIAVENCRILMDEMSKRHV